MTTASARVDLWEKYTNMYLHTPTTEFPLIRDALWRQITVMLVLARESAGTRWPCPALIHPVAFGAEEWLSVGDFPYPRWMTPGPFGFTSVVEHFRFFTGAYDPF